jgi:hypothetical protein
MHLAIRRFAILGLLTAFLTGTAAYGQQFGQIVVATQEFGEEKVGRTRSELWALLKQYPPRLGEVLKLDPSLLSNENYMSAYPDLRTFIQRHPEVARDPSFFFGDIQSEIDELRRRANEAELVQGRYRRGSFADDFFDVAAPLSVFFVVVGILIWTIKRIQEHRQWLRVWRTQSEAHSKLLDRMTSNEDLLAYLNTPAGKRFFESSWIPVDTTPTRANPPVGRIIWSVQAGLLLLLFGISLRFLYGDTRLTPEDLVTVNILSVIGIGLGISFILGAAASFMISARLGLIDQQAPPRRQTSIVEPPSST